MIERFLTYSDIFQPKEGDSIQKYSEGIPSRFFLTVISFLNSNLYLNNSIDNQVSIFKMFIGRQSESIQEEILNNLNSKINEIITIFPLYNNLFLINDILLNYKINKDKEDLTPDEELNILKVILLNNQSQDKTFPDEKNFIEKFWRLALPQFEFNHNKNFIGNISLAEKIFDYFQNNYKKELAEYLKYSNVDSSKTYIKNIIQFYLNGYNKAHGIFYSAFKIDLVEKNPMLKNYIIDITTFNTSDYKKKGKDRYFKGLRERPIIKDEKGNYNIFNWNFVVDKFYLGLIFDFHNNTSLKDAIKFEDFKSNMGIQFSEKKFFKTILKQIFSQNSKEIVLLCADDKPEYDFDFYLRINDKILIIEFKDYLLPDLVKHSNSEKFVEYLDTRFVSNNEKKKGISQLIYQIDKLNKNPKVYEDNNLEKKQILIFPIIIYSDNNFMIPGVNRYLDKLFRYKLQAIKPDFFLIHILTMISMEFFIDMLEYLKANNTALPSLIHSYYNLKCFYTPRSPTEITVNNILKSESSFEQLLSNRIIEAKRLYNPPLTEIYEKYK